MYITSLFGFGWYLHNLTINILVSSHTHTVDFTIVRRTIHPTAQLSDNPLVRQWEVAFCWKIGFWLSDKMTVGQVRWPHPHHVLLYVAREDIRHAASRYDAHHAPWKYHDGHDVPVAGSVQYQYCTQPNICFQQWDVERWSVPISLLIRNT